MKKGYIKLFIFELIFIFILILNSFIPSILYSYRMPIFLFISIVLFKLLFGLEKDKHRFTKTISMDFIIILIMAFIIFYLSGIITGFARIQNYYTLRGLTIYVLPLVFKIILMEILRYNAMQKSEGSKLLTITSIIMFIFTDLTLVMQWGVFKSGAYNILLFIALNLLPTLSNNLTASYITKKVGYKPNILWLFVINLYSYLIPIIPNPNEYLLSIIEFLFPFILLYRTYVFFTKEADKFVEGNGKSHNWLLITTCMLITSMLVYFTSGYFHFHAIAIGSGSMEPKVHTGDVVIIERIENDEDYTKLEKGQIIAFWWNNRIVVHRLYRVVSDSGKYYYYTKGDANEFPDDVVITKDMIKGVVNHKIPYIGLPAVWLSKF